jgi:hypothetical protein
MTGSNPGPGTGTDEAASGWAAATPELVIAAVLVTAVTAAAWAWQGPALAGVVVGAATLGFLGLLRYLPVTEEPPVPAAVSEQQASTGYTSIAGLWRIRSLVKNATESKDSYDRELRVTLQHLLAARLAERHDVSLYSDPQRSKQVFLGGQADELWYWLDPERPAETDKTRRGIPVRTLTAIIERLERL